ncbi:MULTISPECIES: hypothetical protein [Vibrio harveyi group]|uniref:hypothetical protein n=1 Tax=Vibrio harveyi group TaxID=717610 RepID=UPI0015DFD64C|nr:MULTISPECIES: hypothetical protein [Vibrio harveyi group]ELA9389657.1 hypothetical protein [Vibrio parahaemolyticus]MCG6221522.1 hypothetical protein [Vibrio diabolicus]HCE2406275.1 hypothetical protein [Vibrio parahaemolyticus]HCG6477512.1 hypothetical protein [Vibrio parahaemolyticus]
MDFVSGAIIGGVLYDLVSSPIKLTASHIKASLENVLHIDDKIANVIAEDNILEALK